jgi:hypothetical protein
MRLVPLALLVLAASARAAEPMCGTSPENDQRIHAIHARSRVRADAELPAAQVRDGAFYVRDSEMFTPGARLFDLDGQTLVFTPDGNAAYRMHREPLQYQEPLTAPLHDFKTSADAIHYDLAFSFPAFGRSVTRLYLTANNSIELDPPPARQSGMQFDALEAATHRQAILSPFMLTPRKPRYVEAPIVFVEERANEVVVTWRSSGNAPFGYDVQASLRSDGTVAFSYRSITAMRWGAPVISAGFAPATAQRATVSARDDSANDVTLNVRQPLRDMIDLRNVTISRIAGGELFSVRMTLAAPVQQQSIATGEVLGYQVAYGDFFASVEIDGANVNVRSLSGAGPDVDGSTASIDGNVVEIFGIMPDAESVSIRAATYYRPLNLINDSVSQSVDFPAPARTLAVDLSAIPQDAPLALPIVEPFVLGSFDPYAVWETLQHQYGLSDDAYDAMLMYQTYFTDMIFFAGAYATGGNAGVDGIASPTPTKGAHVPRVPTLMHMNQLMYNYSAAETTASKVMLHEFGHRWLYSFSILENGVAGRVLNPVSSHPAAFVHTASAFPVYGADESSVMGGAYFTRQDNGTYRAHAANQGYSWIDLYCMGLASKQEVTPWFYLAGTTLPKEYWPQEGIVVSGDRRDVVVEQMTSVHGARNPSVDLAQRRFRVLFVLVTDADRDATEAEVAKLNEWRAVMARNFAVATGFRGSLSTAFVRPRYRISQH